MYRKDHDSHQPPHITTARQRVDEAQREERKSVQRSAGFSGGSDALLAVLIVASAVCVATLVYLGSLL